MVDSKPATPGCPRPAAPDRHGPKGSVALPLSPFGPRRPASTVHDHPAPRDSESTIERVPSPAAWPRRGGSAFDLSADGLGRLALLGLLGTRPKAREMREAL